LLDRLREDALRRADLIDDVAEQLGTTVIGGSPAELEKLIAEETEKWARVIRFAGIKP
jgi:hypothetical protein